MTLFYVIDVNSNVNNKNGIFCRRSCFNYIAMGVGTRGAEGAAAPPTFGTGEQTIALAPPKV